MAQIAEWNPSLLLMMFFSFITIFNQHGEITRLIFRFWCPQQQGLPVVVVGIEIDDVLLLAFGSLKFRQGFPRECIIAFQQLGLGLHQSVHPRALPIPRVSAVQEGIYETANCHRDPDSCVQRFWERCRILPIMGRSLENWFITVNMLGEQTDHRRSSGCQDRLERPVQRVNTGSGSHRHNFSKYRTVGQIVKRITIKPIEERWCGKVRA